MKICYLSSAVSIHTVRWVNSMAKRGHRIYLLTLVLPKINNIDSKVEIIKLKIPPPLGYYLNFFEARRIINKIKPDIVHAHYASGYGTLGRLVDYNPTILSVWGSDIYLYPYKNKFNMWNIRRNLESADLIASTSKDMKNEIIKVISTKKDIVITPFGIETNKFKPRNKSNSKIVIGTVKKMDAIYGIDYMLKSFSLIVEKIPDNIEIEFLMVGGGDLEYYKKLSTDFNIDHLITFTGQIPHENVVEYLNKLDIYCAPSLSESFGVAVLEASACELPVVTSNVGGLPEVVIQNKTGFLVPPKNEIILAEKILKLILDENKRKEFGLNERS